MVWKLHQWKGIDLLAQLLQRDAPAKSRRRKAGPHVRERRRGWNGLGHAQTHVGDLVTIEGDAVAAQQPFVVWFRLPLAEQFEIEIPYFLYGLNDPVRAFLVVHQGLQVGRGGLVDGPAGGP